VVDAASYEACMRAAKSRHRVCTQPQMSGNMGISLRRKLVAGGRKRVRDDERCSDVQRGNCELYQALTRHKLQQERTRGSRRFPTISFHSICTGLILHPVDAY
jgi:hypothetical protein